ncbi:MAG: hypothetical protein GWN67_22635 [Phycisphaerae bacterium]|nr:hypothetical protein [Phycisphaerae bacterium]NIP54930.1 hypothetical protein [Phycisphaerae bacterium]NIS53665.1 hypothetical protein [Phycisphaerae bacterium]NIU11221.1 hypothetical protein [Phycisphaerae bacterium]NIU59076.1 hypothetical protein [Phycisphaerae bacterium]
MYDFLEQLVLAARRNRDTRGWGNIFFIVALAIFWLISTIFKSMARKDGEEKAGEKQLSGKPGSKPVAGTKKEGPFQQIRRAIEAEVQKQKQLQAQQTQRKVVRPQPAARKVIPTTERVARISATKPAVKAKLGQSTPQLGPEIQELPEFTDKVVKDLKDKRISTLSETPQTKQLVEILSDYSDPEELRRAILHYEILGKPLALRENAGSIIGL